MVVPIFNEEESLRPLHDELTAALEGLGGVPYEIILVDDGSADGSFAVAEALYEADPGHVRVIRLRRNFGQTAALAAGLDSARGDIVITIDADLQNDPADIRRLLEKVDEGYDVVSGWRFHREDAFLMRRLPSQLANRLISAITGVALHDYGCTLKAYQRDIARDMNLYGEQHRFLPALAHWAGARVAEIKVNHRARRFGASKYGLGRVIRVLLDLITVKFLLSYSTKPIQVFGKWGFTSMFFGVLAGLATLAMKLPPRSQGMTRNPLLYLCIFLILGGLQLVSLGLLGEISVRTYYESQKKAVYKVRERRGAA